MRLLDFLRKESTASLHKLIFMAGLAGLSNTLVLAIINSASEQVAKHNQNTRYLLLFAISITLHIIAQRYVMEFSTKEVESIIDRFRVRFATLLGNCDLQQLERLGRSEIYASITTQTLTISQSIPGILVGVQSAILMFFTSIYVAWLSLPAFFISVVFVAIAISIHSEYVRVDLSKDGKQIGTRDLIKRRWAGMIFEKIDTGVYWKNSKVYFFHGDEYIRYDM